MKEEYNPEDVIRKLRLKVIGSIEHCIKKGHLKKAMNHLEHLRRLCVPVQVVESFTRHSMKGKTMKVKVSTLIGMQNSIAALANTKLPAKAGYRFSKALNQLSSAFKQHAMECRKVYVEYGELDEAKQQYLPPTDPEELKSFNAMLEEINEQEVEVQFHPVHINDLNIMIEPAHLAALDGFLITDGDETVPAND